MNNFHIVIVLALAAVVLVGGLIVLTLINPTAALGLSPVLLAVAVIIRAIRGSKKP